MARIHIVTDSGARFGNPRILQEYPITVVPYKIKIGDHIYREDIDLSGENAIQLTQSRRTPPQLIAPSEEEYARMYATLSQQCEYILSIHTSRELTESWQHARRAAQRLSNTCPIVVIDSKSICAGQGMLVHLAAQHLSKEEDFDDLVQNVRDAVDRIYSTYFVNTLDYLHHNGLLSHSHAILGTMLKIKPIISMEEGQLIVTAKVRSQPQSIDHLVDFLTEFDDLDDAMIVQNRMLITEQARLLQDRLSLEFPGRHFPYTMYGMNLASILGGDATGVVVLESHIEGGNDEF